MTDLIEKMARAHCDYFGGEGWWDSGLLADTKPKAIEAMTVVYNALRELPSFLAEIIEDEEDFDHD